MTARVLVVDDLPANVKLLETRLSAEYFDVLTASNGAVVGPGYLVDSVDGGGDEGKSFFDINGAGGITFTGTVTLGAANASAAAAGWAQIYATVAVTSVEMATDCLLASTAVALSV